MRSGLRPCKVASICTSDRRSQYSAQAGSSGLAAPLLCVCRLLGTLEACRRETGWGVPSLPAPMPCTPQWSPPTVVTYCSFLPLHGFGGCLLGAHGPSACKIAWSLLAPVGWLETCRGECAQPGIIGCSGLRRLPAVAWAFLAILPRLFAHTVSTFFVEGVMSICPSWERRLCCPRQSQPSALWVLLVFSGDRAGVRTHFPKWPLI